MFFHQGRTVPEPVPHQHRRAGGQPSRSTSIPTLFDYGRNKFDPKRLRDLGFNGFRVHYAVNQPNYKDEVLVFLGASYFRAVGKGQVYGLSARGLAVDTAAAPGEEFPRFVEFWIERPRAERDLARHLRAARFAAHRRRLPLRADARASRRRCR